MPAYRNHAHSISSCTYHFVWCPKYRHSVLGVVGETVTELFQETAKYFDHEILRWKLQPTTSTCLCVPIRRIVRRISPASSSRPRGSTCWSGIQRFRSRFSEVEGFERSSITWGRPGRFPRAWLNGILRRRNRRSTDVLHPRPRWGGELALFIL